MKVRCIENTKKFGFFTKSSEFIDGLTKGKTYDILAVPIVDNTTFLSNTTLIKKADIKFLLFNDHKQWAVYEPCLFEPIGE